MEPIILTFGKNVSTFLKLVTNLWPHLSQASNKSFAQLFLKVDKYIIRNKYRNILLTLYYD